MTQQFPQYEIVNEKAWERIGVDEWSQMNWFMKLAKTTDFETMTEGEQLLWKEEFAAMSSKASSPLIGVPPDTKWYPGSARSKASQTSLQVAPAFSPAQMQEVRDAIKPHIDRLADDNYIIIGGFTVTYTVSFHKNAAYEKNRELPRYLVDRGEMGGSPQDRLLLHMSKLLETYVDKVRRCPHCKKVFLQFKRSAIYCGPKCYTVAGMRRLRAKRKTQTGVKRKNKKQVHRPTRRGGSRHGKKGK
jgi:hypothetical protein